MRTALALSVLAVAAASQAIVLDDFSDGNAAETHSSVSTVITGTAASVPGGLRGFANAVLSNSFGLNSTMSVQGGVMAVATDPLVRTSANVGYGYSSFGASDLNLDLSSQSAFSIDVLYNDQFALVYMFVGSSTNGNGGSLIQGVGPVAFGSPVTLTFNFSEFGIAMNDVDNFSIQIDGVESNDIVIDNFQAVPEPATMVLGFAAITAIAAKRRRK